ncbi:MAG: TonB-dependent receptor [Sphingorhabdus sp.]|uniref:TonB-dependent receptor domain-containing protein n=1 Tax=Sphingorhabdus sp. TaxID=1902408 RepID=UPI0025F048C3|nr:TonB-dependent receptor [Sphingorhabdus sp.]MCO4092527.1 TonB-dependent receptor [Sphingorhabdus sp.]
MKKTRLLIAGSAISFALFAAAPSFAQEVADVTSAEADEEVATEAEEEEVAQPILVTGSRIARPTLQSAVPLTSVTIEDLTGTGEVSLGDALNDLPSLRSTFSSGNSSRFIGTAGLSLLDLRGLGTDRTLVLVNGRRHVTSTPGDNGFDVNTIPTDLVERIDLVTGGNSAVYGSDAVAGVVNFILRRDYDGITARAQGGISSRGDRGNYFASVLAGQNFADGRGNVTVSAEYTRQQPLLLRDRDALTGAASGRCQFQTTDPQGAAGGEVGFSATDGIPDNTFICGIKNGAISDAGTIGRVGAGAYLRFSDAGDLYVDTAPENFESAGSTAIRGGNGSSLRNTGSLLAAVDRYAVNLLAHFDVSDAFKPFIEAKYVRADASGEGQPSFFTSIPGTLGGEPLRCSNGFLSAQNLSTLRSFGLCPVGGTTAAQTTFGMQRFNIDLGGRGLQATRETYRAVGGIEGTFNEDWNYEFAVNYGRFEAKGFNTNNLILFTKDGSDYDGFNQAVQAVVAPASFTGTNFVLNSAGQRVICAMNAVTNVNQACVPINVFGQGRADPRALDFVNTEGRTDEFASQFVASAFVGGDLSQIFELPGGPVAFAIGAEYRKEKASVDYDELTSSGATFLNALQDFRPPSFSVKEAYGEIQIPLLKDMPFAKELSVNLAGRVSDYNTATGTVYAYTIQGVYAPIDDIRLRASYATSVRAPTQGDLFGSASENFAQLSDPCDLPSPGSIIAANCAAAGVPTTFNQAAVTACESSAVPATQRRLGDPWVNCLARTASTGFVSGGNPTLTEEKGKSLTLGVVLEPNFIPGLSLTVDYYKIEVEDLIATLGAQQILNLCYANASGLNNPFCATVQRNPTTGLFVEPAVISGGVNFAAQKTKGIDFDLAYRKSFDNGDRVTARMIVTKVLSLNNFTDPTNPVSPNRQKSELGDPEYSASFSLDYDFGDVDILYTARYIGKQTIGGWETQNNYSGQCPLTGAFRGQTGLNGGTCDPVLGNIVTLAPQNLDAFPRVYYPDALYHDIRLGFEIGNDLRFYAGVGNVLDTQPPLGLLGTIGGDPFDSFGRNFFFGINANF